jgi:hypothetical protein
MEAPASPGGAPQAVHKFADGVVNSTGCSTPGASELFNVCFHVCVIQYALRAV